MGPFPDVFVERFRLEIRPSAKNILNGAGVGTPFLEWAMQNGSSGKGNKRKPETNENHTNMRALANKARGRGEKTAHEGRNEITRKRNEERGQGRGKNERAKGAEAKKRGREGGDGKRARAGDGKGEKGEARGERWKRRGKRREEKGERGKKRGDSRARPEGQESGLGFMV